MTRWWFGHKEYLSKLVILFVQIGNCICPNCEFLNCQIYLWKWLTVKMIGWPWERQWMTKWSSGREERKKLGDEMTKKKRCRWYIMRYIDKYMSDIDKNMHDIDKHMSDIVYVHCREEGCIRKYILVVRVVLTVLKSILSCQWGEIDKYMHDIDKYIYWRRKDGFPAAT